MKVWIPAWLAGGLLVAAAAIAGAQPGGPRGGAPSTGGAAPVQLPGPPAGVGDRGAAQDRFPGAPGRDNAVDGRGRSSAAFQMAQSIAQAHFDRLEGLVKANPQFLEMIDRVPAVRGEIIAIDPSPATLEAVQRRGYAITDDETVEGLDTRYVTLSTPAGRSLKRALAELRRIARHSEFAANHVHVQSGVAMGAHSPAAALAASSVIQGSAIGIIDGGVGKTAILPPLTQRGFARRAPAPNSHATAVASLAAGVRPVRSGAPGAPLLIADIYGTDPRGGNSLALARALGWMATRKAPVVLISLVGPPNPIVANAIRQVRARGMHVVAPVGNAGPAAPPMYPASYPGVIAVTGVDGKNRALIEAGRGPHVDYAAPGADIFAASLDGKLVKVRGTSFAAPLVAGRLWLAARSGDPVSVLDRQAVAIGRKGEDRIFGRGLICGECR
jgi:minor extracellular protease Epr